MRRFVLRPVGWMILVLVGLVAAVNLIWFVAPILGDPSVYRPLFGIVLVVVASTVWRQVRGEDR